MVTDLSVDELARRIGQPPARVREWRDRCCIGDSNGQFRSSDIERARLVAALLERGVALDAVARALADHRELIDDMLDQWPAVEAPAGDFDQVAIRIGLAPKTVQRMRQAAGLEGRGEGPTSDDVDALQALKTALDAGLPEEAVLQILRVYGEALGRVAEAEVRLFHIYVHQRLRQHGLSGTELMQATRTVSDPLQQLVEPTVLYFHRRAWDQALREDLVNHVAEEAGLWATVDTTGQLPLAVVFIDLAGFTSLTEAMGDAAAAEVVDRFAVLVRDIVGRSPGQVVKQIGDEFMLSFPDATSALRCAIALEERASAEPQFPSVRVGAHWGPVLYRDGDYVGATVNVASRVVAEADSHEVLVTQAVADACAGLGEVDLVLAGRRRLKGVPHEMQLYRARLLSRGVVDKRVDPVCRMELTVGEVETRLEAHGIEHVFCSTRCLELFVANPEIYS